MTVQARITMMAGVVSAMGCAAATAGGPTPVPCGAPVMREVLYLGRLIGDTGMVSDSAWEQFVAEVVTPAFPDGFSVVSGVGQWRGADGKIISEPNKMVIFSTPGSAETEAAILRIGAEYRIRFHQEAVLHEHSSTCVTLIN